MKFKLRPILSEIKEFYQKPISPARFKEYISMLQGDSKDDLKLPIAGYNPMAKAHIIEKIEELEALNAEALMEEIINEFNENNVLSKEKTIEVVLNLADDLKGGWTNFYTSDYHSKFNLNALVNRNFCAPYFWSGEVFSTTIIQRRTKEFLNRTIYRLSNPNPTTLEDHVEQEIFVFMNTLNEEIKDKLLYDSIQAYYLENRNAEEYDLIFNFLYGDAASESLGYKKYGRFQKNGFEYAKFIAMNRKKRKSP